MRGSRGTGSAPRRSGSVAGPATADGRAGGTARFRRAPSGAAGRAGPIASFEGSVRVNADQLAPIIVMSVISLSVATTMILRGPVGKALGRWIESWGGTNAALLE